jgi:apolipoprotein N-acyltransferase
MSNSLRMPTTRALSRSVPRRQVSRLALAVLSGLLFGACFAPLGAWPLAFAVTAPLVPALSGVRARRALWLGWVAGTVGSAIAVGPWISAATYRYFDTGVVGAAIFALGVGQLFHAWPTAAFAALASRLLELRPVVARALALGAAWTALEYVRSTLFTGAPWDLLAHALYAQPRWIQLADLGGAYAVSFVAAASGAALGVAVVARGRERRGALATAIAVLLGAGLYGTARLAITDDGPSVRVALVQGNVSNAWRESAAHADRAFDAFADATRGVLPERPALVVWSENALSFVLAPNDRFRQAVAALLASGGPPLLIGGPRYEQREPGRVDFFNSAYVLDDRGAVQRVYDKRRLVPFAEYAPVRGIPGLGWRFDAPGAYTAGTTPVVFEAPAPFGVLICYEAIYPWLARELVAAGAQFLVNVSNDAWFGTSAGLEQHFASGVFRAVETRRALARGTNTGITALVGPSGRILARFPTGVRGAWVVDVPLRTQGTAYGRFGDVFAWTMVVLTLGVLAAAGRRTDRPGRRGIAGGQPPGGAVAPRGSRT